VGGGGLCLAQFEAQSDALDRVGILAAFQRVPGPPPAEVMEWLAPPSRVVHSA
jgi:hypothetical protein